MESKTETYKYEECSELKRNFRSEREWGSNKNTETDREKEMKYEIEHGNIMTAKKKYDD